MAACAKQLRLLCVYATTTGTARKFATDFCAAADGALAGAVNVEGPVCMSSLALPDALSGENKPHVIVLFISTAGDGDPPATAVSFFSWMTSCVSSGEEVLKGLGYCVFGLGDSAYPTAQFCAPGRKSDQCLRQLGAVRVYKPGTSDSSKDVESAFKLWLDPALRAIFKYAQTQLQGMQATSAEVEDIEDTVPTPGGPMVTESQRRILTKEGYIIIGTHSAAKQCRWTKNALRGRGFCYKYTFYGIRSHQCMEFTPALACANKCVFCWRHHNNPVGTEWIWKVDDPTILIEEGIKAHQEMIKPLKGVPGVIMSRYEEGFNVRHCAMSLVGEPIMYPKINEFVGLLHQRGISSFMVTNAQFPSAIRALRPVTQLYLSIDAATPETLHKIDRPLFPDFWERYLECMDIVSQKRQRTVFRITMVKGWNFEPPAAYAALIKRGKPHFVEIKGATYCGGADNPLSLDNIPWHDEVLAYSRQIEAELPGEYEIASEHMHSCCVLLARLSLKQSDGRWNTWIDQDQFMKLANDPNAGDFDAAAYSQPLPAWAVLGSTNRGLAPTEQKTPH